MVKKILLLKARTGMDDPSPPMAFTYLGGVAKEEGFEVVVENLNAQYNKKTNEDIIKLIKKEKFDIVGIHIFTNAARYSYRLLKDLKPYCKLLLGGGPHPTVRPEEVLEQGADFVFIGESEVSFRDFLKEIKKKKPNLKKVKGVGFIEKGKFILNSLQPIVHDLDKIGNGDKSVHRVSDYVKRKDEINNFGQILSTRGCPGRCNYCSNLFKAGGKPFRVLSAKKVYDEIIRLKKNYGVNFINFIDDAFTIDKKRLNKLCEMMINNKLGMKWSCSTRVDFLDEKSIEIMGKAGCKLIILGIESAVPKTLIKTRKTANPEWYSKRADEILEWCWVKNIRVGVNILTGFPWEEPKDMRDMQEYIHRIKNKVTQGFYGGILQPQPNTDMYENYKKKYNFEKWWLYKKPLFKDDYRPFFMAYYHVFWDHLQNNFYGFSGELYSEIDKLYKIMGRWNLYIFTKRRFKNPLAVYVIYQGFLFLSRVSFLLFKISPSLERKTMERVKKFSYQFKFRKGDKKLN